LEVGDESSLEPYLSLGRRKDQPEHAEQRRLAAARRSGERDDLAGMDGDFGRVDDADCKLSLPVDPADAASFEESRARSS
jgi:hypothetical protein